MRGFKLGRRSRLGDIVLGLSRCREVETTVEWDQVIKSGCADIIRGGIKATKGRTGRLGRGTSYYICHSMHVSEETNFGKSSRGNKNPMEQESPRWSEGT